MLVHPHVCHLMQHTHTHFLSNATVDKLMQTRQFNGNEIWQAWRQVVWKPF